MLKSAIMYHLLKESTENYNEVMKLLLGSLAKYSLSETNRIAAGTFHDVDKGRSLVPPNTLLKKDGQGNIDEPEASPSLTVDHQ